MRVAQKPRTGISRQRPRGDEPTAGRSYLVRTKHGQARRRADLLFGNEPTTVMEAEIGAERMRAILEDRLLQCTELATTA